LRETHDATLVLGQILGALIFGLVMAPLSWVTPDLLDLTGLFLLGIVSMGGHACVNRSLKTAPASVVAPYQYTLIIWAIVLGYLAFGDVVEFWTLVGAAVICAAGLALILFERETARRGRVGKDISPPVLPEI
jgi:drug/metabolite transporter (DMT)-like permease